MRNSPRETVDLLLRRSALEVRRLIPALLQSGPSRFPIAPHAIRYLHHAILILQNRDAAVNNALLSLHATASESEGPLLDFLDSSPDDPTSGRPFYDLDYALRICKRNKRVQACVQIYSKMSLFESSVDLALENGDIDLAQTNADKPKEDDLLRKKLWLKIAKHVVRDKNDIKA